MAPYYNTSELQVALSLFLSGGMEAPALTAQPTYQYDLVMLTAQVPLLTLIDVWVY